MSTAWYASYGWGDPELDEFCDICGQVLQPDDQQDGACCTCLEELEEAKEADACHE
jgi:hypothetical protein